MITLFKRKRRERKKYHVVWQLFNRISTPLTEYISFVVQQTFHLIFSSQNDYFHCFPGANYFDNTSQKEKEDDVVWPNREHVYYWEVTSDVSPQHNDPTCLTYTYISHKDVVEDYNSGLIGVLLVCKPGEV